MINETVQVAPFVPSDLEAVMEIEPSIFSLPWSRHSYEELLKLDSVQMFVAKVENRLVGYMLFQWWGEELELHTIGVASTWQRKGVGRQLIARLIEESKQLGVVNIFLLVRPSNIPAKHLYEGYGFKQIGVRPRYYGDNQEDALVMRSEII